MYYKKSLTDKFNQVSEPTKESLIKIEAELDFATKLAELRQETDWECLIKQAGELVSLTLNSLDETAIINAVEAAEKLLTPIGKVAKQYTCHCIGHGHMDMNWMWSWPETVAATNDMFITVDKLMDEFPEFCFSQSQAAVYEIIREHNPQLFARIKQRVKEGRWEITASEWVEGDKNLASGESLAQHLLYTRQYMQKYFNLKPDDIQIAWNPDTFGHAETIPMIMSAGGVKYYYMCRGGEQELPPLFWWQSADGSRLLVNLEHTWYNDSLGLHNIKGLLSFCRATGLKDWMLVYGVGDHGGGPTRRDLNMCIKMDNWPIFPNFKFSTTHKYFRLIEQYSENLPVKTGELNFEFTGCYSSQSDIKKTNRLGEIKAEQTQTTALLAWQVAEQDYPADRLRQAWTSTLFGHFHDILPGSGIKATREYHAGQFQQSAAITGMIQTNSLRAVAAKIDTTFATEHIQTDNTDNTDFTGRRLGSGPGLGSFNGDISMASHDDSDIHIFTIFNPVAVKREEVVILTVWDTQTGEIEKKRFSIYYPDGSQLPVQRIDTGETWGHHFVRLAVPVKINELGYCSLKIIPTSTYNSPVYNSWGYIDNEDDIVPKGVKTVINFAIERPLSGYFKGEYGMESSQIMVRFDKSNGNIIELTDKTTNNSIITPTKPAELLKYVLERAGNMSSWLIHPAEYESDLKCSSFKPKSFGPYLASYEAEYKIHDSKVLVIFTLSAVSNRLDIELKINWREHGGPEKGIPGLRLQLPANTTQALYETPFGTINRDALANQEVPSLRFVNAGKLLLLNDCKYGFEFDGEQLQCTLIRSTYDPDPIPEHGEYEMKFGIIPHGDSISKSDYIKAGINFNNKLQIISTDNHNGALPTVSNALIKSNKENVIICAVKKSTEEDAIVIRLQETIGDKTLVEIGFNNAIFGRINYVTAINLLESEIDKPKVSIDITANGFYTKLNPYSITSIKVKFK